MPGSPRSKSTNSGLWTRAVSIAVGPSYAVWTSCPKSSSSLTSLDAHRDGEETGCGRTQNAVATRFLAEGSVRWLRSSAGNRTQSRDETENPAPARAGSRVLEESQEEPGKER